MQKEPTPISAVIPLVISDTTQTPTTPNEPRKRRQGRILDSRKLWTKYFEEFHPKNNQSLQKALDEAMKFCIDMASPHAPARWLSLLGKSGTGKTMLARRITRYFSASLDCLLDENKPREQTYRRGGLKPWGKVVEDMLEGDFSGIRDLKDDWFVVLDDIGAEYERCRELSVSKLYDVLNARENRFTVITANLTLEDVNRKLDARIASRLLRHGNVVVDIDAEDYNL